MKIKIKRVRDGSEVNECKKRGGEGVKERERDWRKGKGRWKEDRIR